MKHILLLLLIFSFLSVKPVVADGSEEPFLAVFCADHRFAQFWEDEPVDYFYQAKTWDDFKIFIKGVKAKSKGRPVIIDVQCHGSQDGYLGLYDDNNTPDDRTDDFSCYSNTGYILSETDKVKDLDAVLLEACFGGYCYYKQTRTALGFDVEGKYDTYKEYNKIPEYPVYSVDNCVNWNNSIYAQIITGEYVNIHDAREFEQYYPGDPEDSYLTYKSLALKYFCGMYRLNKTITKIEEALYN